MLAKTLIAALLLWRAPLSAQTSWKLSYFHDEDDSSFTIRDFQIASRDCGLAVGALSVRGKLKPHAVASNDGGKTWRPVGIKDDPRALSFLNDKLAWMVGEDGLWRSADCGQTWERIFKQKSLVRARMVTADLGYAVGAPKRVWQTRDGGKSWQKLLAADQPAGNPERSIYSWIEFSPEGIGVIAGFHEPERWDQLRRPAWVDPDRAQRQRQWPSLSLLLQSNDGGKTWHSSTSSIFGHITRIRLGAGARGLALVEFPQSFEWPSEVYRLDLMGGKTERVFRETNRAVTDIALLGGRAYLGAVEPPGNLRESPIPGKVKMLRLTDAGRWEEMEVDYRATARRVTLAGGDGLVMAATDTGMILRLQ